VRVDVTEGVDVTRVLNAACSGVQETPVVCAQRIRNGIQLDMLTSEDPTGRQVPDGHMSLFDDEDMVLRAFQK
jgi:hypothetical protein